MKWVLVLFFIFSSSDAGIIVIDPGHGGKDTGAKASERGRTLHEKDLNLDLARYLYSELKRKHKVYLTRESDKTLSLLERSQVADKVNADLFISIHFNYSKAKSAKGMEIYYLTNKKSEVSGHIEKVENKYVESDWNGVDQTTRKILIDMIIEKTQKKSLRFARALEKNFKKDLKKNFKINYRGTKAELFFVLALSKRPGVLIEVGFMTNPKELSIVQGERFKKYFATRVADAVDSYFTP